MIRRDGDRAVTVQIGAVLLLAIVFSALALYQVNAVPVENRGVEIDHNRQVHGELQDLRNALRNVGTGGGTASASVTLGTRYPDRTLLVNPPDPTGTLETTGNGTVRIDNAQVNASTRYEGDPSALLGQDFETTTLAYTPDYAEYRDAPTTRIEHGFVYDEFDDATVAVTGPGLLDDGTIRLVLFEGSVSESGRNAVSLDPAVRTGPTAEIPIEREGSDNVTLTLPTAAPAAWNDAIGTEFGTGEPNARVVDQEDGWVRIELAEKADGNYRLQMARVGLGDGGGDGADEFDISEAPPERTTPDGGAYEVHWDPTRMASGSDRLSCSADRCTLEATVSDDTAPAIVETVPSVDDGTVEYAVSDRDVASFNADRGSIQDGDHETTLVARSNGTVGIFASGGGSGDRLNVTVELEPGGPPEGSVAYHDENDNGAYDDGESTYSERDLGGVDVEGSVIVVRDATRTNGIDISAGSITIAEGARLATENGGIALTTNGGELSVGGTLDTTAGSGQDVSLDVTGRTTLSAGTIRSSGGIDVASTDAINAADARLDASDASYGSITLTGPDVSLERATVLTEGQITVTSAAALDATAATLESTGDGQTIALESSGDMDLGRVAVDVGPDGTMSGELNQGRNSLTVDGAAFRQDGGPGTFEYSPNGVSVVGDPAVGSAR